MIPALKIIPAGNLEHSRSRFVRVEVGCNYKLSLLRAVLGIGRGPKVSGTTAPFRPYREPQAERLQALNNKILKAMVISKR